MSIASRLVSKLRAILLYDVDRRLGRVEYHAINRRFYAIEQATEYLIGAQVPGDYLEFGVWQGTTFSYAFKWLSPYFQSMRFCAFDSFEGLPEPGGVDAVEGYTSNFHKGDFACSEESFKARIAEQGVDLARVVTVPGWFERTLTSDTQRAIGLEKAAFAWIDCDLYESAVPVLRFITPLLTTGAVVLFDDWRCFRNDPARGVQRACREWLAGNPRLHLAELFSFGWNGMAFTVLRRDVA